jgi:hypothetical protein
MDPLSSHKAPFMEKKYIVHCTYSPSFSWHSIWKARAMTFHQLALPRISRQMTFQLTRILDRQQRCGKQPSSVTNAHVFVVHFFPRSASEEVKHCFFFFFFFFFNF